MSPGQEEPRAGLERQIFIRQKCAWRALEPQASLPQHCPEPRPGVEGALGTCTLQWTAGWQHTASGSQDPQALDGHTAPSPGPAVVLNVTGLRRKPSRPLPACSACLNPQSPGQSWGASR